MTQANEVVIKLPRLHSAQLEIKRGLGKYSVLACGRRFGKTTLALYLACEKMLAGERVIFCAPVYDQTKDFWKQAKRTLRPLIIEKDEQAKEFSLVTGGKLRCFSLNSADVIRSGEADFVIVDEASFVIDLKDKWGAVLLPLLIKTHGGALFISTPQGFNEFYELYMNANDNPSWKAFNYPTMLNPHLSTEALGELTKEMTPAQYQNEILATFLAEGGGVFVGVSDIIETPPDREQWGQMVAGVDWGSSNDYTAVSIWDASAMREVAIERMRHASWQTIRTWLVELCTSYGVSVIYAESNSIGSPNIEALRNDGYMVRPFAMTSSRKGSIVGKMKVAIERKAIRLTDCGWANSELRNYGTKQNKDGSYAYEAPAGQHDDSVVARMIALFACERLNLD